MHFDQENTAAAVKRQQPANRGSISRHEFSRQLINKVMSFNENAYKKIMECEKIFLELKKLSEKAAPQ